MGMLECIASEDVPGLAIDAEYKFVKNDSSPAVYGKLCLY
jgi:hypothetical protein